VFGWSAYSRDARGRLRWGDRAAGLLILSGQRVLLMLRSAEVMDPGTWGIPGGRVERGQTDWAAARKETCEELGSLPRVVLVATHEARSGDFTYTTFVVRLSERAAAGWKITLDWENDSWGWFSLDDLPQPLHPGVAQALWQLLVDR
jgi:8-oxo-dGTP pyrophosphatase MutT (NUDIX family)